MKLPPLTFFVFDTETTGFVPKVHKVIEFASITYVQEEEIHEFEQLFSLPAEKEIPPAIEVLTRIQSRDLHLKPTFSEVLPRMRQLLPSDAILVGQNIGFDISMLKGEGWDLSTLPYIDTSMLASIAFPELESYSLGYVSAVLKLPHDPPHRALGDARATLALLEACTKRFCSLPEATLAKLQVLADRGPAGYQKYFDALTSEGTTQPNWLHRNHRVKKKKKQTSSPEQEYGKIFLQEEGIASQGKNILELLEKKDTWLAVKNIDVYQQKNTLTTPIMYEPERIVSPTNVRKFFAQKKFHPDEVTLAIKMELYQPDVQSDLPLHGEEYKVFAAKIACRYDDPQYLQVIDEGVEGSAILSHEHLLMLAVSEEPIFSPHLSVVIDDASMLEDTATSALTWSCSIPRIRAAAQGDSHLTECVDSVELWMERMRNEQDVRYIAPSDIDAQSTSELKKAISELLTEKTNTLPALLESSFRDVLRILDHANLNDRITWIEVQREGSKTLRSVPLNIADTLEKLLYSRASVTLLVPPKSKDRLQTIVPSTMPMESLPALVNDMSVDLRIETPINKTLDDIFHHPIGKTIVLVNSKKTIEDMFIKHAISMEEKGITLICQGFSGGQGRMSAEFVAAKSPAFLVMTPWSFEGLHLAPASVNQLVIQALPFDHPSHAVVSRRAAQYRNGFADYSFPRLLHRLFRILRHFKEGSTKNATCVVLDERLRTKSYGKETLTYLQSLCAPQEKKSDGSAQLTLL